MTQNNINNTSSSINVSNLTMSANTLSSSSGDLILETDGVNAIAMSNGASTIFNMTNSGSLTMPLQPCFLAYLASDILNQTGNSGVVTIAFTEVYDIGSNFSSTTFTAPVAGIYMFSTNVTSYNLTSSMVRQGLAITTTNGKFSTNSNAYNNTSGTNNQSIALSCFAQMDALDTAFVTITIDFGAGNTADITGHATELLTYFTGSLIS